MTNQEIKERINIIGVQLEKKKKDADSILLDIEKMCKELLSLQELLNRNNAGQDKNQ